MRQLWATFSGSTYTTKQKPTNSPTVSATIVAANKQASSNSGNDVSNATEALAAPSQQDLEARLLPETSESYKQRQAKLDKASSTYYTREEEARQAAAKERLLASFSLIKPLKEQATKQEDLLVASETQVEPKAAPNTETPSPFNLVPKTKVKDPEERLKELEAEAERVRREEAKALEAERVRQEAEAKAAAEATERARLAKEVEIAAEAEAEKARPNISNQIGDTPKDDENDEQKKEKHINNLFSAILDNINDIDENLRQKIIAELLADFTSNQDYIPVDTSNITKATDSTQQNPPIPTTRHPLTHDKYTAKLAPKTYYGVGIQTKLVQEENQPPFLQINQFYDDSGFKSALESKDPPIETANTDFKITAICCELGDGKKDFYTIDQIFKNCNSNEETFNLKLCDIFRNPQERNLELKFSTLEGSKEDQELTIQKSVFTKDEHSAKYKDIKTVISESKIKSYNPPSTHIFVAGSENIGMGAFLG
jgi:hypothetical protein